VIGKQKTKMEMPADNFSATAKSKKKSLKDILHFRISFLFIFFQLIDSIARPNEVLHRQNFIFLTFFK